MLAHFLELQRKYTFFVCCHLLFLVKMCLIVLLLFDDAFLILYLYLMLPPFALLFA